MQLTSIDVLSEFVDDWCWIATDFLPVHLAEYSFISSKPPLIGFYAWYFGLQKQNAFLEFGLPLGW